MAFPFFGTLAESAVSRHSYKINFSLREYVAYLSKNHFIEDKSLSL